MKYIKGLDTIRAIAVLCVIVGHWGLLFTPGSRADVFVNSFVQFGLFGVVLFFVLSGFLITTILLHEKTTATASNGNILKTFYARRVLRIFPIYYLVIFIYYFIFPVPYVKDHVWYFLTYTSNMLPYFSGQANILAHTWSLSVEEQFYLIWPWLIIFIDLKYLKYVFIALIVIGITSKYIVVYQLHHQFPYLVVNCFDSLGLGGLYAYVRLDKERAAKFDRNFIILLPVLLFIAYKIGPIGGLPVSVMYYRAIDSVIGLAAIIFVLNNKSPLIQKYLLENRALNYIGKISYGIYLYHYAYGPQFDNFVARLKINHPSLPDILFNRGVDYMAKIAVLFLICSVSFYLIEQPILRLKRKFQYP